MPVYQYRCTQCQEIEEALQKVADPPLTECPKCHGKLQKIIAPVGIIFKGSGWHINDYKPTGAAGGAAADKPKSESKPSESSGDAAPASTPAPSEGGGTTPAPPPTSPSTPSQKQVA